MGILYLLTNYMGVLKKQFYDARMKDVLLQTATIAEGSIEWVLDGQSYKRGVRQYKIFYKL